jgi:hypothetical protein
MLLVEASPLQDAWFRTDGHASNSVHLTMSFSWKGSTGKLRIEYFILLLKEHCRVYRHSFFLLILPNHFRRRGLLLHLITIKGKKTHTHKHTQSEDFSGRGIGPSQRPLPENTQHPKKTHVHTLAGFKPEIPASERPETHDLDSAATGIGLTDTNYSNFSSSLSTFYFLTCN